MTTTPTPQHHRFTGLPLAMLVLTALLAIVLVGGLGAEMFARHKADSLVSDAVQCEAQDTATVSFATSPPMLAQYFQGHYPDISVQTAGNQLRSAKGMKLNLDIHDIQVQKTADSKGTIGSIDGTITWPADGIKSSIEDVVPVIGSLVASHVTTSPGDGTIELKGLLSHATVKPQISDNALKLEVVDLSALGLDLDNAKVQSNLDELTTKATNDLPLGIHLDSAQVTDSGLVIKFAAQNSTIPAQSSSSNGCFASL
ncbi:DUF2993 domain-containing protein [Mycobacterium sp. M1]|uniref:DUF2993 domain-containing protein n=1 Tax=Mycolicibacter acidiphilus TaxID=2835306 RepID=A0ABS5RF13_9MYCO|nr:DUF2993 domain-containing protein [Mycolicibacter acidiphilus]MBS9532873.1 DUF2993 domain-containing protein [Mycolicibacter acidiphilus]